MAEKDYSATPLWKKLGVKEGARVCLLSAPHGFALSVPEGVRPVRRLAGTFDVILLFATREAELTRRFRTAKSFLTKTGGLWVAHPKKSSDIKTDLAFENVQRVGLVGGLVDNKSCAIDDDWSGLRFVYRLKDR